jgi:acyl-CoA thioesterase
LPLSGSIENNYPLDVFDQDRPGPLTQLFDLKATHNPHRYYLPVAMNLCAGIPERRFLFGGVGLAAAISAMERTCDRPVIWATAHYLAFARPGSVVDLDVWVPVEGNSISQASVVEHIDDQKIITVNAALGDREDDYTDQWLTIPDVPAPMDCPDVHNPRAGADALQGRFEVRLAGGRYPGSSLADGRGDGKLRVWIRSTEGLVADRLLLAVMADYVSEGIGNALGFPAGGNSLDNTIRYGRVEPVEWVLCDTRIESVHRGIVHGAMRLFSPDGTLMASASQSLILRRRDRQG